MEDVPCPATNGHPRRAVNLILIQVKALIEIFNQLYISPMADFKSQMVVYAETLIFLHEFSRTIQTCSNASKCIRMYPNVSEQVRTGPIRSEQDENL